MIVQLSIDVKKLKSYSKGEDFVNELCNFIYDGFNDDGSIGDIHFKLLHKKKSRKKTKK